MPRPTSCRSSRRSRASAICTLRPASAATASASVPAPVDWWRGWCEALRMRTRSLDSGWAVSSTGRRSTKGLQFDEGVFGALRAQLHGVVVIGGCHKWLTAAFHLARAGLNVLVHDPRPLLGACAITEEIDPLKAPG